MKDNSKPSGKVALVDTKPISIPMISSTSSSSHGRTSPPISPAVVEAAVAEAIASSPSPSPPSPSVTEEASGVKSISRSQVASRPGLVSRSTQTGTDNMPEDLQEKRRLIRKQLAVLLHSVLCRVRDELIGNVGPTARACPTGYCGTMKNVLTHLRTCEARQNCPYPHCLSSRQILTHWKLCSQVNCPVCGSLRRVVPTYLNTIIANPRWREQIRTRFHWLITFIGPANLQLQPLQQNHEAPTEANGGDPRGPSKEVEE